MQEPGPDPPPEVVAHGGVGVAGRAVPEVLGPSAGHGITLPKQLIRGLVGDLCGRCFGLSAHHGYGCTGWLAVNIRPGAAYLGVPLEVESQEVEALVNMDDVCFLRG